MYVAEQNTADLHPPYNLENDMSIEPEAADDRALCGFGELKETLFGSHSCELRRSDDTVHWLLDANENNIILYCFRCGGHT